MTMNPTEFALRGRLSTFACVVCGRINLQTPLYNMRCDGWRCQDHGGHDTTPPGTRRTIVHADGTITKMVT